MSCSNISSVLTCLMILIFAVWTSLWVLKPTQFLTNRWKDAEEIANQTLLGYYGNHYIFYKSLVIRFLQVHKILHGLMTLLV